ncbi:protein STRUBBELIG-RECEPTOR FAMILY 2 isoform X2 [Vigna radiata var. radiata]|uniref:Protein STRUBBELIG-RECEPTOR FAMILY 2 isoform X2 n=1 Tax=Vigna radiata var. radiata TaxID=3916 RepID=A0A3Q0EWG2_VIGRR|nr:protein STRUBBELIG-RECEPTOR FAMILY 2 isoform X2 [Vigna radiata var. radiata]
MIRHFLSVHLNLFVFSILISQILAFTHPSEVSALQDLYRTFNYPPVLNGWNGSDPCGESWTGIACSGPSVIQLKLQGLNLTGYIGSLLYNLPNLKQLDVSSNNIEGEIPFGLPPNITYMNLSHNLLHGPIGDVFSALNNLKEMDLSYNNFSGDLPYSFGSLRNLARLFLQNNRFTGSVTYLAELPLTDLNIQDNLFSGILPQHFQSILNLWIGDNKFHVADNSPPWTFPPDTMSIEQNTSIPPTTQANVTQNYSRPSEAPPRVNETHPRVNETHTRVREAPPRVHDAHPNVNEAHPKVNEASPGLREARPRVNGDHPKVNEVHPRVHEAPPRVHEAHPKVNEAPSGVSEAPPGVSEAPPGVNEAHPRVNEAPVKVIKHKKNNVGPGGIAFMIGGGTLMATGVALFVAILLNKLRLESPNLKSSESSHGSFPSHPTSATIGFSKSDRYSGRTKIYTVAELELATNCFSEANILGEGSLGPVYRAKFPDDKILAVKEINIAQMSLKEEEKLLDVICTVSRLKHPNIVALKGYCLDKGKGLLVYDYVGNVTLNDALHSEACEPVSWVHRLRIALGVAQALDYLHSAFCRPVAHGNLKAANVLLDENLMPRVCDCSLVILRTLTISQVEKPANEIDIEEMGYHAPDHGQQGTGSRKRDVFAFGVLLLELLTGKKPFDRARPVDEQYLVKWAPPMLPYRASLEQLVDPRMKRTFSSKALSRYADIISLCIQPARQLRPAMSEVMESLESLYQMFDIEKSDVADGTELDPV